MRARVLALSSEAEDSHRATAAASAACSDAAHGNGRCLGGQRAGRSGRDELGQQDVDVGVDPVLGQPAVRARFGQQQGIDRVHFGAQVVGGVAQADAEIVKLELATGEPIVYRLRADTSVASKEILAP